MSTVVKIHKVGRRSPIKQKMLQYSPLCLLFFLLFLLLLLLLSVIFSSLVPFLLFHLLLLHIRNFEYLIITVTLDWFGSDEIWVDNNER